MIFPCMNFKIQHFPYFSEPMGTLRLCQCQSLFKHTKNELLKDKILKMTHFKNAKEGGAN